MPQIPRWLTGAGGTITVTLVRQTVAADGTLADDAAGSQVLTGDVDSVDVMSDPGMERIDAMTSGEQNNVGIDDGFGYTLVEILKDDGVNLLAAAVMAGTHFKIVFVRGEQTWTGWGRRGRYDEGVRRGKSVATLNIVPVAVGAANPTYA